MSQNEYRETEGLTDAQKEVLYAVSVRRARSGMSSI